MKENLLIFNLLFFIISFAQNNSFVGKVLDYNDNSSLIGVNVVIEKITAEHLNGTATNLSGEFTFYDLEIGQYKLMPNIYVLIV